MTVPFESYTLVNIFSSVCNDKQRLLVLIRFRKLCPLPAEYCRHSYYCINNRRLFPLRTAAPLCSQLHWLAWWKPRNPPSAPGVWSPGFWGTVPQQSVLLQHEPTAPTAWDAVVGDVPRALRQSR